MEKKNNTTYLHLYIALNECLKAFSTIKQIYKDDREVISIFVPRNSMNHITRQFWMMTLMFTSIVAARPLVILV